MKLATLFVFLAALIFSVNFASAQTPVSDLQTEIQSGRIAVESMRGNGSSSGLAIEGRIRNTTPSPVRININLRRPMYLGNQTSGTAQNMVAFNVYERGGAYYTDGHSSFVKVPPDQSLNIHLLAYCADYEKDNPSAADQFAISEMPPEISGITQNIADYKRRNPEEDVTIGAQIALWFAQGLSPDEIRTTFQFSDQDEMKAREIIDQ